MRPAGDVRRALLFVACARFRPERGATQRELAEAAQVSYGTARDMVHWLHRSGVLRIVRTRRVPYRNRPVAEYAPAGTGTAAAPCALTALMQAWAQA